MTRKEIRLAAQAAVPTGFRIGSVGQWGDGQHYWAKVLFGDGEPISRLDAPDNTPVLRVDSDTGETHWFDCATGQATGSPID